MIRAHTPQDRNIVNVAESAAGTGSGSATDGQSAFLSDSIKFRVCSALSGANTRTGKLAFLKEGLLREVRVSEDRH
jgi:hypothetical protein